MLSGIFRAQLSFTKLYQVLTILVFTKVTKLTKFTKFTKFYQATKFGKFLEAKTKLIKFNTKF